MNDIENNANLNQNEDNTLNPDNMESNYETPVNNTESVYMPPVINNQPDYKSTAKKNGKFRKSLSYIAVGLICATIGGAASGIAMLYALPKTDLFKNTELYKSLAERQVTTSTSVYDGHPTQLAATSGAMTISDIAKKVGPAVVAVTTTVQGSGDFFGNRGVQGVGTGMIINKDGYILTNYHVVNNAQQVKVILSNNKTVNAKVVNYDANYDVAVVKITDKVDIPAVVELGNSSNLQVGESVVAIGNPLGTDFMGSVTTGIVSALNRQISGDPNKLSYIQTDAAINSGNSGGPLINSSGQVIGINTAKIKDSGVEGLGFAIPIDAVKDKITDLSKPVLMIGIQGREIDKSLAQQYNMPVGLYVQEITEFSPAEKAGLKRGDIIIKFDGQKVTTFNDMTTLKNKHKAGDVVPITINRDGEEKTLSLKLAE